MRQDKEGLSRHDSLVYILKEELCFTRDYDNMWLFMGYLHNGIAGEVDLLALADRIYDFYEIKTTYSPKSVKKAGEQFGRFRSAFPGRRINGFLYTGDRILRRL